MGRTSIEWTEETWNPVRGCSIYSPGCKNCYAMRQAHRHASPGGAYQGLTRMTKRGPVWTGEVRPVPAALDWPLRLRKPRLIFVNSMSDLFHEDLDPDFIAQVFATMAQAKRHTFQVLTKRAERMQQLLAHDLPYEGPEWPLPNVWLGVSVEDQERADERIPHLLRTPAAVRWISAEPLLGPIDLRALATSSPGREGGAWRALDWVVAGGESGPGARPMHPEWARALRDQCAELGIPYLFKQWGAWVACETEPDMDRRSGRVVNTLDDDVVLEREGPYRVIEAHQLEFVHVGKKAAGRVLDGRIHDEYPR